MTGCCPKWENPERPDSILEHSLPDDKMERLYKEYDWDSFSDDGPDRLKVQGYELPYAVMENEDDVTSECGKALEQRLEETIRHLWRSFSMNRSF